MAMSSTGQGTTHLTSSLWLMLPFVVLLAYTTFLLTGFGRALGAFQAVPVYVFLCLVLLTLQQSVATRHTLWHFLYVLGTSAFAVVYVGEFVFHVRILDATRHPATYVVGEVILLAAFVIDMVGRARQRARSNQSSVETLGNEQQKAVTHFGALATDVAGLAVFFLGSALLFDLLGGQRVPHALGIHLGPPHVVVDLNRLFHLTWSGPVNLLEGLDLVLGLAAAGLALALLVMAGALLPSANDSGRLSTQRSLWQTLRETLLQMIGAVRLVLSPLIWFVPAFALAHFAQQTTAYFNRSAQAHSTLADLFNPFSATGVTSWRMGVGTLLLGLVAVAAMVMAVMVIEQEPSIARRTWHAFRLAGRAIALTWALFMYSLALINAVAVLLGLTKEEPFQVGAPGLIALIVGGIMLWVESHHLPTESSGDTVSASLGSALERGRVPMPGHG